MLGVSVFSFFPSTLFSLLSFLCVMSDDCHNGGGRCEWKFLYSTVSTSESSVQLPPLNTQEERWARCKTATFGSLCILYVKLNIFVNVICIYMLVILMAFG